MHYIKQNIVFFRDYNRWVQQELADKLETTLGRVKSYERGGAMPPIDTLVKLSDLMKISIDAIIRIELTAEKYRMLKKEQVKEKEFYTAVESIVGRLDIIEKKLDIGGNGKGNKKTKRK